MNMNPPNLPNQQPTPFMPPVSNQPRVMPKRAPKKIPPAKVMAGITGLQTVLEEMKKIARRNKGTKKHNHAQRKMSPEDAREIFKDLQNVQQDQTDNPLQAVEALKSAVEKIKSATAPSPKKRGTHKKTVLKRPLLKPKNNAYYNRDPNPILPEYTQT